MAGLKPFFLNRCAYLVQVVVLPAPAAERSAQGGWARWGKVGVVGRAGEL